MEELCDPICIHDFSASFIGSELEKAMNRHWRETSEVKKTSAFYKEKVCT